MANAHMCTPSAVAKIPSGHLDKDTAAVKHTLGMVIRKNNNRQGETALKVLGANVYNVIFFMGLTRYNAGCKKPAQ